MGIGMFDAEEEDDAEEDENEGNDEGAEGHGDAQSTSPSRQDAMHCGTTERL